MAITAQSLITRAYRLSGAVASGDDPTADESSDGLLALNEMLDNWSEQGISVPWTLTDNFNLSPGTITYNFGPALPGAPATLTKPIHITDAWLLDEGSVSDPFDNDAQTYPFEIIDSGEYARIAQKGESGRPSRGWYNYGEPNGTLVIDRDPDQVYSLIVISTKEINTFDSLSDTANMPLSYIRALRFNLAVELGGELGSPMDPRVLKVAGDSFKTIKNSNAARRIKTLTVDAATMTPGRYDIASDNY